MKRTTLFLTEDLERDLQWLAAKEGRPTAAVVREALSAWVAARRERLPARPGFVATAASGRADTAESHETLLWSGLEPHESPPRRGSRTPAGSADTGTSARARQRTATRRRG